MQKFFGYSRKNLKAKKKAIVWQKAPDIKKRVLQLSKGLNLNWVISSDLYCFRSLNSKTKSVARIWGLGRIWQIALKQKPSYIIEVISERFNKLSIKHQDKVLIHELAHIPKSYSGSLLPHVRKRGKRNFRDRLGTLFRIYELAQSRR